MTVRRPAEARRDMDAVESSTAREGAITNDMFAFLTINPNAEVGGIHPKAMPMILRTAEEMHTWMTMPAAEALKLQRPLPDGALRIVTQGEGLWTPAITGRA